MTHPLSLREKLRILYTIALAKAVDGDGSDLDLAAFTAMDDRVELLAEAAEKAILAHAAPNGAGDAIDLAAIDPVGCA